MQLISSDGSRASRLIHVRKDIDVIGQFSAMINLKKKQIHNEKGNI